MTEHRLELFIFLAAILIIALSIWGGMRFMDKKSTHRHLPKKDTSSASEDEQQKKRESYFREASQAGSGNKEEGK